MKTTALSILFLIFLAYSATAATTATILYESGTFHTAQGILDVLSERAIRTDFHEINPEDLKTHNFSYFLLKEPLKDVVSEFTTYDPAMDIDYYGKRVKKSPIASYLKENESDLIITNSRALIEAIVNTGFYAATKARIIWIASAPMESKDIMLSNRVHKTLVVGQEQFRKWQAVGADSQVVVPFSEQELKRSTDFAVLQIEEIRREDFGRFMGTQVEGGEEAIKKMNAEYPADFEILIGHRSVTTKSGFSMQKIRPNPYGHIAVRIRDNVYTIDFKARPAESRLHIRTILHDYFYSVMPTDVPEYKFVSMNGQAYGRENFGIRISGLSDEVLDRMEHEFEKIEKDFIADKVKYHFCNSNCVDFANRVGQAGGMDLKKDGFVSFPGSTFQQVARIALKQQLKMSLVRYGYVQGANSGWRRSGPAMAGIPAPFKLLAMNTLSFLGMRFGTMFLTPDAQVYYSPQQHKLVYEDLKGRHLSACLKFYK